jgi:hypothetical protein
MVKMVKIDPFVYPRCFHIHPTPDQSMLVSPSTGAIEIGPSEEANETGTLDLTPLQ